MQQQTMVAPTGGYDYSEHYVKQQQTTPFGGNVYFENKHVQNYVPGQEAMVKWEQTAMTPIGKQYQYYYDHNKQTPGMQVHEFTRINQNTPVAPMVMVSSPPPPPPPPPPQRMTFKTYEYHANQTCASPIIPTLSPQQQMDMIRRQWDDFNQWVKNGGKRNMNGKGKTIRTGKTKK